jgi:hypothetical protein
MTLSVTERTASATQPRAAAQPATAEPDAGRRKKSGNVALIFLGAAAVSLGSLLFRKQARLVRRPLCATLLTPACSRPAREEGAIRMSRRV